MGRAHSNIVLVVHLVRAEIIARAWVLTGPELNEGADNDDDEPEFDTALFKEVCDDDDAATPARGAETLFA